MKTKVIKTEAEHEAALARLDEIFDAQPGTPRGEELELLTMLVESYEEAAFPIGLPDPIAAIRFRMEQQGLKPKDLVPYIGSASKVSEVLSGSRSLSLSMIRGLASGLGIPAEVLVQRPGPQLGPGDPRLESHKFPIAHMLKRGWFQGFSGSLAEAKAQAPDLLAAFAANLGSGALRPALNRQCVRSGAAANDYALTAWRIRVATRALRDSLPEYRPGTVTQSFLRQLLQLSYLSAGRGVSPQEWHSPRH
jgi:HTH-type transcriptional regulator/antitoxin HigA